MAGSAMRFPSDVEVRSFATATAVLLVGFQNSCRSAVGRLGRDHVVRATARFLQAAATTDTLIVAAPEVRTPGAVPTGVAPTTDDGRNGIVASPGAFAPPGEVFRAFDSRIVEMRGDGALHAFANTGLDEALAERGIRDVIIASALSCASTDATARAARARGYRVTLLSDCTLHGSGSEHRLFCETAIPLYAEVAASADVARRLRAGRCEDATSWDGASDEELQVLLRHQLLGALAEREDEAAAVQRLSGTGSWSWSPGDDVFTWSDAARRLLGAGATTSPPHLDGFLTLLHPFDRERVEDVLRTAARTGEPFRFQHRIRGDEHRMFRVTGDVESGGDGAAGPRVHGITQELVGGAVASSPAETRDPLTGLANHALFLDYAERAMARASRFGWTTAVVIVDIDRFRQINEAHGHVAADEVLTELARRLSHTLRESDLVSRTTPSATDPDDLVSRWGGDRFAAICENTSDEEAVLTLIRRIRSIACEPVVLAGGVSVEVTVGIGAAIAGPGVMPVEQQIRDAEDALRLAKASGRSGCELARDGAASRRHGYRDAAAALQQALDNQEFVLHFQPKLSLEADRFIGAEALLRWQHPERGLVPPLEFIPLAEETGMIVPIGAWVIEESCRQFAEWHRLFPRWPPLIVAVNVSGQQFGPALVTTVADALSRTGAGAGQLCLEVTESTLITDADGAIETLHRLTALGVKVSIDDFGTGYSSLSYLKRLPLHELKIDKTFVDGLGEDPEDTAIVGATVAMAHALGLSVVAEGVETADQLERLRVLGCQEVQGYYVARPMAAGAFAQLLSSEANGGWRATASGDRAAVTSSARAAKVLIVDDTPDVRQLARMALNASGFEVFEAADGSEAVAMVSQLRPDCVLLDVSMPGISGLQVCRVLRSDPANDGCTIVMLTADTDSGPKVQAFGAGADDYIVKPFSPRDLVSRVRAALRVHDQVHS